MSIIYILIPLAIIIVSLAIGIFFWAVKSNQFDDLERHGYSILFDDDIKPVKPIKPEQPVKKPIKDASNQTDKNTSDEHDD
jgi:cbb3-type cytochrome oxidase maturation protein